MQIKDQKKHVVVPKIVKWTQCKWDGYRIHYCQLSWINANPADSWLLLHVLGKTWEGPLCNLSSEKRKAMQRWQMAVISTDILEVLIPKVCARICLSYLSTNDFGCRNFPPPKPFDLLRSYKQVVQGSISLTSIAL